MGQIKGFSVVGKQECGPSGGDTDFGVGPGINCRRVDGWPQCGDPTLDRAGRPLMVGLGAEDGTRRDRYVSSE